MTMLLDDRVAVVTGASGGIGRAVAVEFARAGAHVVVHAHRRMKEAETLAAEIAGHRGQATVLAADLSELTACESFAAAAWQWKSRVDVLVNVAGADVLTGES